MATMNISLPTGLRDFVEAEVTGGGFASVSDYVRDLIRNEQAYRAELRALEAALAEGRASGVSKRGVEDIIAAERARIACAT